MDDGREIRVLHLEPSRSRDAPILCGLNTISLDDYPQWKADYTALSYTWDGQTPSCEVDCDGARLLVTPNCDAAIRELRHEEKIVKLWIDSICINQSLDAIPERNHQVALMGEIYKSAAKVVVWLSTSNRRVEAALNQLVDLFSTTEALNVENDSKRKEMNFQDIGEAQMDIRANVQMALGEKVGAIARRVTKESEDPFECGQFKKPRFASLKDFTYAAGVSNCLGQGCLEVLKGLKLRQFMIYLVGRRYAGAKELLDNQPHAKDRNAVHNDPLMFSILTYAREKASGDPRDKVFALCGLLKELEIPFPNPDYSKSVEDVYREAVVASIEYDKNLYILYHAPSDKRRKGLASWVPDWAEQGFSEEDGRYGLLRSRFAASGSSPHKFEFSQDKTGLVLFGKIIDEVIFCAEPLPDIDNVSEELRDSEKKRLYVREPNKYLETLHNGFKILKNWVEISQWADYPTGESSQNAFQRTVVNDSPDRNERAVQGGSFLQWYNTVNLEELDFIEHGLRQVNLADDVPKQRYFREAYLRTYKDEVADATLSFLALKGPAWNFHIDAMIWSAKKCLFRTENDYIGTAPDPLPDRIRPGDKIAIVSGLEMPLLLRAERGGYKLITHVYVHGIMYGEKWPESKSELEEIVLL
ncbi:hypothetical protein K469DRAFT_689338 [Zopfia rhizophila CBS 207.26]|uniref:Heterokaryon incompatibility domain-containing protein n=1 Tax=Zopfia rhizophila CBS 207.26 TaxID=1314779 RepID=A0A6A6EQ63_9PEZI|nr:hypothetical protein K469DRAFT_689338 [Zopfia rhizophila CBS 207.26]